MFVVDTDCFSEILAGVSRYAALDRGVRSIAVVTTEEVFRGRLAAIRAAQADAKPDRLIKANLMLRLAAIGVGDVQILPYIPVAHEHYLRLRSHKIRVGTRDLRIASIALAHGATLVTRDRRDFDIVPSLQLEVWN